MAINLVPPPTGGAPVSTTDYNAQNVNIYAQFNSMDQNTLHLTEWDTLTVPKLKQDVYISHGGSLFQVQTSDYTIGGAPANGNVYVKVSRSGDTLIAVFVNSIVGYSWDFNYNGFYHADGSQILPYVLVKSASGYNKYSIVFQNLTPTTEIKAIDDIIIEADNKSLILGAGGTSDFEMYFNGTDAILKSGNSIGFQGNLDTDDYVVITTTGNVPHITTAGSCNLKITASSGLVDFDNDDLTTTGDIDCDILTCNGIELENYASGQQAILNGSPWVPPKGLYLIASTEAGVRLELYDGSSWEGYSTNCSGLIYFDGTNMRIWNNSGGVTQVYYFKYT